MSYKILHATAECVPFAKVGGLADVVGALTEKMTDHGLDCRTVLPYYGQINDNFKTEKLSTFSVLLKDQYYDTVLHRCIEGGLKGTYYFIEHPFFNDQTDIYWDAARNGISDVERFVLFSKAVMEIFTILDWWPDVIHCHDWHTAIIPELIDIYSLGEPNYPNIKTVLTIHNLAAQGKTGHEVLHYAGMSAGSTPSIWEDFIDDDKINLFKLGILSADKITTVSPTYAKEVLSAPLGMGLESYLSRRKKDLQGIINGLDTDLYDPATDKKIAYQFDINMPAVGKAANKIVLQEKFGLAVNDKLPVLGLVTRIVEQKGLDIIIPQLSKILSLPLQFVILGTGQPVYEQELKKAATKFDNLGVIIDFDDQLARQIFAGSDLFLVPSRFEPCGLTQMIAMRYSSLPLVRSTGGLKDTVLDHETGFVFKEYTGISLFNKIAEAVKIYNNKPALWQAMLMKAARQDWSWDKSIDRFINIYEKLTR
ncbi:MAG: glycogen synthase [Candidatus Komeilibacteria bacterium]|nr:glycogen synthase [Candidatus Komeilibacteria bacterium]